MPWPAHPIALMPVHHEDIAANFDELADLLEIEDANPLRVRAYRNAARAWPAPWGAEAPIAADHDLTGVG